jgi:phosphomannomutase / phosphoglucomutase
MSIYKACDIRGEAGSELSPELYRAWGQVLGGWAGAGARCVVGGDVRLSTPAFVASLVEGLLSAGVHVLDLGVVPTPMVYFAERFLETRASFVVTASHSPAGQNGLKWTMGGLPPREEDVQALAEATTGLAPAASGPTRPGERTDFSDRYRGWLRGTWGRKRGPAGSHIILDPGNGCWSSRAKPYLEELFPGVRFSAIHDWPDGSFPERPPDSARPANLTRLSQAILCARADLGIAFDGDGDRVAFVDGEGQALTAEESTWVMLQALAGKLAGRPFVYDLKFSDLIPRTAVCFGATPVMQRSGHAFIRRSMIEVGAGFGAEISGHFFYRDLQGSDDALYSACVLLAYLGACSQSLSALRRSVPSYFITPDLRLSLDEATQALVIAAAQARFAGLPQSAVDGTRITFPDGWALIRKSVTEQALTFRFEGRTQEALDRIVREVSSAVPGLGSAFLALYESSKR